MSLDDGLRGVRGGGSLSESNDRSAEAAASEARAIDAGSVQRDVDQRVDWGN